MPRTSPNFQHAAVCLKNPHFSSLEGSSVFENVSSIEIDEMRVFRWNIFFKKFLIKIKTYWIWYKRVNIPLDEKERTKGTDYNNTLSWKLLVAPPIESKAFVTSIFMGFGNQFIDINVKFCQKCKFTSIKIQACISDYDFYFY